MDDEHGDLRPDVLNAISHTVSEAIWFGLTTGYLTMTGSYHIPRKFLPHYGGDPADDDEQPSRAQERALRSHVGAARFAWKWGLGWPSATSGTG